MGRLYLLRDEFICFGTGLFAVDIVKKKIRKIAGVVIAASFTAHAAINTVLATSMMQPIERSIGESEKCKKTGLYSGGRCRYQSFLDKHFYIRTDYYGLGTTIY
ncbi:hypothetical protein [Paenibacillus sp. FSL P4-0502]|uniref:hypothetical protein n=1 Tax=Paenibacillus sp. FSL P4-0502 TaxID=2975319 RepID=UPI0030FBAB3F